MPIHCHSCAAPLDHPAYHGAAPNLCRFCTDDEGNLKPKKEVRAGIAEWMMRWQPELGEKEAVRRARRYMRTMPAWAK